MSNQGSLRKSSRQPVPNPIYLQSIKELKRESTVKPKRKGKNQEMDCQSYQEEPGSMENQFNSRNQSQQRWVPCILDNGAKIKVQIIPPVRELEDEKKKEVKTVKKKPSNLLSIFQQVISDNQDDDNEPQKNIFKEPPMKTKIEVNKLKRIREDNDGKITNVVIHEGFMKIDQSKLGKIEIPIDWKDPEVMKAEEDSAIAQIRKKLQNCKSLQGLEIFTN